MGYWLYVDDATNRARIHQGFCPYGNHGRDVKKSRLPDNRWLGPFKLADAVAEAKRIGKRDTAGCHWCLPDLRSRAAALPRLQEEAVRC